MMNVALRFSLAFVTSLALLSMTFAAGEDQGSQVMVTRPGVVFHLAGAHDFHGHAVGKSMEAAMAAGYVPCPVCFGKVASTPSAAHPGAAATAAFGAGSALAPVLGATAGPPPGLESRGGSRVMATGCTSHDAVCPYGLPFRTIPGL